MTPRTAAKLDLLHTVALSWCHALAIYAGRPLLGGWPQHRMALLAKTDGVRRCRSCGYTVLIRAGQVVRGDCPQCRSSLFVLGENGEDISWISPCEMESVKVRGCHDPHALTPVDFCVVLELWADAIPTGNVRGTHLLHAVREAPDAGRRTLVNVYAGPVPVSERNIRNAMRWLREAYEEA